MNEAELTVGGALDWAERYNIFQPGLTKDQRAIWWLAFEVRRLRKELAPFERLRAQAEKINPREGSPC